MTTSKQTQLAKYTYGSFGEVLLKEGVFDLRYQFSTKKNDSITGLNYYGFRFYNPEMGWWLNRDPIGEPNFRGPSNSELSGTVYAWQLNRYVLRFEGSMLIGCQQLNLQNYGCGPVLAVLRLKMPYFYCVPPF